jgi:hypothetical protein
MVDQSKNTLTKRIMSVKPGTPGGENEVIDKAEYMPDKKHIIKDNYFFYFSQSGVSEEFLKRRLVLTRDKLCLALEGSDR